MSKKQSNPEPPTTTKAENFVCFKFENGDVIRDKVSGFVGVVMGRTDYATGCHTYGVAPTKTNKEGRVREWEWFDEDRIELLPRGKKVIFGENKTYITGGPAMPRLDKK